MITTRGVLIFSFSMLLGVLALSPTSYGAPYTPVDEVFWDSIEKSWQKKKWTSTLRLANNRYEKTKESTLERAEVQLAAALTLIQLDLPFSAHIVLSEIVRAYQGTNVGWRALEELDLLVRSAPINGEAVTRGLIMELDLDQPPEGVADFIYYNRGLANRDAGFKKWSQDDLKKLNPTSYWGYQLQYQEALKKVVEDKTDEAYTLFTDFTTKEGVPGQIREESLHQLGRLEFEKENYEKAYEIFEKVRIRPRERGAILLERAWSRYYLKDYPKALGLLTALEAPVFDTSRSPEAYILKMLIYKDLCYFDSVYESLNEFNSRFKASLDLIKKRREFSEDRALTVLSLVDRRAQIYVDAFNQARKERERYKDLKLGRYENLQSLEKAYVLHIRRLKEDIDYGLFDQLHRSAEKLLDWSEQISFLDYQTRIDQLRMTKSRVSRAEPSLALKDKYKVSFLFVGEYWRDELEDLRVDVTSQCGGNLGR